MVLSVYVVIYYSIGDFIYDKTWLFLYLEDVSPNVDFWNDKDMNMKLCISWDTENQDAMFETRRVEHRREKKKQLLF